jgi:hypothetical protein
MHKANSRIDGFNGTIRNNTTKWFAKSAQDIHQDPTSRRIIAGGIYTVGTFYIGDGHKVVLLLGFKTESAARDYFRRHRNIANEKEERLNFGIPHNLIG